MDESFIGVGIWRPDSTTLNGIRAAIDKKPKQWLLAKDSLKTGLGFELVGDSLKRPPRDYDKAHPQIVDLKRKDFIAIHPISSELLFSPNYLTTVFQQFAATTPFMKFLCKATEVPF
ncbi:MAG: DUF2461 domain-containing protein [Motiliproteus sp.]|nr:DUF2461 domain-containing protein [Motiliproteus sp.]MCW9052933.1 DUF2461 domain-containing protein [Motiliproteus sp.]